MTAWSECHGTFVFRERARELVVEGCDDCPFSDQLAHECSLPSGPRIARHEEEGGGHPGNCPLFQQGGVSVVLEGSQ